MSGPKVVRIVTREELIDICRGHIARFENAVIECERIATRNQVFSDSDRAQWRARLANVEQLLQQDKFAEVQKQVPRLVDSMHYEVSQKLEALHSAEAAARRRVMSLRHSARQLQAQLHSVRVELPLEVKTQLQAAVDGGNLPVNKLEEVIARALHSLPLAGQQELTPAQQDTLRALSGDAKVRTFADWLSESQKDRPQSKQLDRLLGQLAACEAMESFQELSRKADAAYLEIDERRRHLLIDSLCLEAAAVVRAEQRHAAIRWAAADEKAVICASGDGDICREGLLRMERALADRQFDVAERELQKVQQIRNEAARRRAAQAARITLLQGLQEIGYTVTEGMATIWNQRKSLVVRHPQQRGIAVELGAVGQNDQFQARVVSIDGERRDDKSDVQTETEWCSNLTKIQSKIAQCGGELIIERATPAGRHPLKSVRLENDDKDAVSTQALRSVKK